MSRDLEEQLDEMGPEYRAVALRLREAQSAGKRLIAVGIAACSLACFGSQKVDEL